MTRHKLNEKQVRNAKPDASRKPYELNDGGGLVLLVAADGAKYWRFRYTFEGRRRSKSLGVYDAVTLSIARGRADEARREIAAGVDPLAEAPEDATGPTVETLAEEWLKRQTGVLDPVTWSATASRLRRFVFPEIGARPIKSITSAELWPILERLQTQPRGNRRGSRELAHRIKTHLSQIWRYAAATGGRAERDITSDLRGALLPNKHTNHARLKDGRAIGLLLLAIDEVEGLAPVVRAAMQLIALTFVRSNELRLATWAEIDLARATWTIPARRMKQTRAKAEDHVVPLSTQAVAILRALKDETGDSPLVFPGPRSWTRPISDMTLTAALRRLGYGSDQMQIHGWRGIASTRLRDDLGFPRDLVEVQLAHTGFMSTTEAAYNHAQYLGQRAAMVQAYADHLDALRDAARVRPLPSSGVAGFARPVAV